MELKGSDLRKKLLKTGAAFWQRMSKAGNPVFLKTGPSRRQTGMIPTIKLAKILYQNPDQSSLNEKLSPFSALGSSFRKTPKELLMKC
jgi:hypothetical protein